MTISTGTIHLPGSAYLKPSHFQRMCSLAVFAEITIHYEPAVFLVFLFYLTGCFCYLFLQLLLNSHSAIWRRGLYLSHSPSYPCYQTQSRHPINIVSPLALLRYNWHTMIKICWMSVLFPTYLKQPFLSYFKYRNFFLSLKVAFHKYCLTVDRPNQGVEKREWGRGK